MRYRFLIKIYRKCKIESGDLYCRPPGFAVMLMEKYLAGGLQSGSDANLIGVQYK